MREIVGGVVRYRDLVAKIKIAKFFPGVLVICENLCSQKFPTIWYHERPLSFVLTFYSLSKEEITDERVCALVRELQVNQSHQKLE